MSNKLKMLTLCAVLAFGASKAFSITQQKATCDASNTNKCVITNVGEGTGALIVEGTQP